MNIISHRGYWKTTEEKNKLEAFSRSFSLGFGTETDVRDYCGELVISHDIPIGNEISFESFLSVYSSFKIDSPLALNIKADGLQDKIESALSRYDIHNAFVFDMSVPDELIYLKNTKNNVYSRCSEFEQDVAFYDSCSGIWLDCFNSIWYDDSIIKKFINDGKSVCVVSSELHKRDETLAHWTLLKKWNLVNESNLILCTDLPEQASEFFKESL
ncbi:phosphodiesterase [Kluyvera georgiana]|uniref:phosphodiesterase n=1 Tax=Kluyvera georgiana TaxID=73098 RepID=UPI00321F9049